MGIIYEETGQHRKALDQYKKAYTEGLDSADLYNNWGKTCFSLGMVDKAIDYLKLATQIAPEHPESHYNLGIAYSRKGMLDEARREMTISMKLKAKK